VFGFKRGEIYYVDRKIDFILCVGFDQYNFKFTNCKGQIYKWEMFSAKNTLLEIKPLFPLDS